MNKLRTIGYYPFSPEEMAGVLTEVGVNVVADVRTTPYSRYKTEFNRDQIETFLKGKGVGYVFLGRELGARPEDKACYVPTAVGKLRVDFDRLATTDLFKSGILRLVKGISMYNVALLCAERDPMTCHRAILISRRVVLLRPDIEVEHIMDKDTIESHKDMERRMFQFLQMDEESLFNDSYGLLEQAYSMMGEKIAYVKDNN